ncbi:hypothetical protein UFOVP244_103 [uncultured Caudovirales phage]|uniref:Uncharacterized protein n=1 Tax=uncultured Caudovirales phage TaxID=2100421 RepID=A0A6J7WYN8_9CAUD|nr:hypothetical protein UFOVP244_103 [uncultured Caudovirales phage]
MNQDKDKLLCEKYPKLFSERNLPMTQSCMYWGFEIGDGWFNIIDNLCANIQHHLDSAADYRKRTIEYNEMIEQAVAGKYEKLEEYWSDSSPELIEKVKESIPSSSLREVPEEVSQVVVSQVKEKFGTLRFYYYGGDEYVAGLVAMAESMSGCTCEDCGSPAKTRGRGWVYTRCDKCQKASGRYTDEEDDTDV